MTDKQFNVLAYIITFRTYGTWLHGDPRTSVDPKNNTFGTPRIKPNADLRNTMAKHCKESAFLMNVHERQTVLQSIIDTCQCSSWYLHAAHVRTNHVHIVMQAQKDPGQVAVSLKAYATRYLKKSNPELNREQYWARGSSEGHLFESTQLLRAIQYTIEEQGKEMALYCDPSYFKTQGYV